MSPSRNFPARAEPSYQGSELSRAELVHFNFRAENKLTIKFIYFEKTTKFFKTSTLLLSDVLLTKLRRRFGKILWPSQNIQTLLTKNSNFLTYFSQVLLSEVLLVRRQLVNMYCYLDHIIVESDYH